ncbi:uncharacterized protein LOC144114120 [Amblyomma americanum]
MNCKDTCPPEPSGDWDLEDVCTVLGVALLLVVGLLGLPLCLYWDTRCVLLTIGSLVVLCFVARAVHERRRGTAALRERDHWLSLTASFLVRHSSEEREPLAVTKCSYSV